MDIHLAILQLGKNNNQYTVKDDGSGIQEWRGSDPQPTEAELTQAWADWQAAAAAVKYKTDRTTDGSTTYDTIGNQLDMLYADMLAGKLDTTGTWATHIKAVKDANPKPS
jgi:hypothetical protein